MRVTLLTGPPLLLDHELLEGREPLIFISDSSTSECVAGMWLTLAGFDSNGRSGVSALPWTTAHRSDVLSVKAPFLFTLLQPYKPKSLV